MRRTIGTCLTILALSGVAAADDLIQISDLLADPDSYHFRVITLEGTVQKVTLQPPYVNDRSMKCYGSYTFQIRDGTGLLDVTVLGICGQPILRAPEVIEGEQIVLKAQIFSSKREIAGQDAKGGSSDKEPPPVRVVANQIRHTGPAMPPPAAPEIQVPVESEPPHLLEQPAKPEGETGY